MDDEHQTIKWCKENNIKVAIGHTGASYDECLEASLDGATSFTHTYNGMRGLHHREPGVVGAALSLDNMYAELIGDGVHVHFVPAKILARAKGKDKLLLITDSVQVKGLPVGKYEKGLSTVEVKEDGLYWEGKCYKSLSGLAMAITEYPISGYVFFHKELLEWQKK